jgi:putative ABC transport system ATP-binding protein
MDTSNDNTAAKGLRGVALDDVSLRVSAGAFVAVMGPSGSGKSTLLRLAGGLDRPTSGRVLLAGRDLAVLDEAGLAEARRREIGFVFQEANLLASLTAAENVALALELDGVKPKAAMAGAHGLLDSLGLGAVGARFLPASYPGVSNSRWRSPGRSRGAGRCCWPTSRPVPSTRSPANR